MGQERPNRKNKQRCRRTPTESQADGRTDWESGAERISYPRCWYTMKKNSHLGAERFWIELCSMVIENDKRREKVKERIHGQTRFEDKFSNRSPATVPEMFVGIS